MCEVCEHIRPEFKNRPLSRDEPASPPRSRAVNGSEGSTEGKQGVAENSETLGLGDDIGTRGPAVSPFVEKDGNKVSKALGKTQPILI